MTYPAEFEAFWSAYPKRVPNPKAVAFQKWQTLLKTKTVTAEELTRAAAAFAAECARLKTEQTFIVHARTFLSQGRFSDYLPKPEAVQAVPADLPELFHRLRARRPDLTEAVWKSWLASLRLEFRPKATITAPSAFHRQRVETDWGADLAALLGPIVWRVAK
jgi:hypothetical protein